MLAVLEADYMCTNSDMLAYQVTSSAVPDSLS